MGARGRGGGGRWRGRLGKGRAAGRPVTLLGLPDGRPLGGCPLGDLGRLKKDEKGRALSYHPPLHAILVALVGWLSLDADRRTLIE
jgi:hypothetical protein